AGWGATHGLFDIQPICSISRIPRARARPSPARTSMTPDDLSRHAVVSHDQWIAARTTLLAKEKELTRARDELNRLRRALPWERVEKTYAFDGPDGKETLAHLFAGPRQL